MEKVIKQNEKFWYVNNQGEIFWYTYISPYPKGDNYHLIINRIEKPEAIHISKLEPMLAQNLHSFEQATLYSAKVHEAIASDLRNTYTKGANSEGMTPLKIYQFQAKKLEDTFRLVERTLGSKSKESSIDRDVMQCWQMVKNILNGEPDKHVPRI